VSARSGNIDVGTIGLVGPVDPTSAASELILPEDFFGVLPRLPRDINELTEDEVEILNSRNCLLC